MKKLLFAAMFLLLCMASNAVSAQFVDPKRNGISDDILRNRAQQGANLTRAKQQKTNPRQTIGKLTVTTTNEAVNAEFVGLVYNSDSQKLELQLMLTSSLPTRSVYATRVKAYYETGEFDLDTQSFSLVSGQKSLVTIPFLDVIEPYSILKMNVVVPLVGIGEVKIQHAPINWK